MGYCGLDRRRQPLVGDEIRACWEAGPSGSAEPLPAGIPVTVSASDDAGATATRRRDFIEIVSGTAAAGLDAPIGSMTEDSVTPSGASEPRWSLWSDLEA